MGYVNGNRNTSVRLVLIVDGTPQKPLDGFCSNFLGLLDTTCCWSYYVTILICQILLAIWDLLNLYMLHWRNSLCFLEYSSTDFVKILYDCWSQFVVDHNVRSFWFHKFYRSYGTLLNLYMLHYRNIFWTQLFRYRLVDFWNFIGLLVTIWSWLSCLTISIQQILQELWDFVEFVHAILVEHIVDATLRIPLDRFC